MYPNLYFIIEGITGVQPPQWLSVVQTFGLFFALSFIIGGVFLALDFKRRTELGQFQPRVTEKPITGTPSIAELITNGVIGFLLGFKLIYILMDSSAFIANPQAVLLSLDGVFWGGVLGALALMANKYWEKRQEAKKHPGKKKVRITTYPQDMVGDILIVAAISGIIGAKLFAVIEYPEQLIADPIGTLFSGSGLAIYGGLILGFFAVFYFIKSRGLSPLHTMDAAVPALIISYGIGRMGCHFSGDGDWGIVNANPKPSWLPDWMWSFKYPHNVNRDGVPIQDCEDFYGEYCFELPEGVYPTSVYETLTMLILFVIVWFFLRHRIKAAGLLFYLYMIINGIERYLIEIIRVNDRYDWFFNLTQAQIIALAMFFGGIIGSVWAVRRHRKLAVND